MSKCNQADCTACPYIREGKHITINKTHWRIEKKVNCNTDNLVYTIICKHTKFQILLKVISSIMNE